MRLGIIGTGRIAKRAVRELSFVKEIEIAAVYNPNFEHAKAFADEAKVLAFSDMDSFAAAIDAVYIASPHATHYRYAKELMKAGKHVICEKPLAFEGAMADELFEIACNKKLVFMEGIKTAYSPGFKKLEEVVESGVIGDVADVEAAFTRLTLPGCREFDDRRYGGSFTEFGTYTLLPILRFLGTDYEKVEFECISAKSGVDGYTKVYFNFGQRAFATAKTGLTVKSEGQLLISGTNGYILVPSPWWLTKYFEVRYEDPKKIERYECEFEGDGLRYEFREFARRIDAFEDWSRSVQLSKERQEAIGRAKVYEEFQP